MSKERRKHARGTGDRRRETRKDVPVWGYALAIVGVGLLLSAFWSLVYT